VGRKVGRIERIPARDGAPRNFHSRGNRFSNLHIYTSVMYIKDEATRDRDTPGEKPSYGSAIPSSMSSHKPTCYRSPSSGIYEQLLLCLRQESSSIPLGGRAADKQRRQRSTLSVKIKIVIRGISLSLSLSCFFLSLAARLRRDLRRTKSTRRQSGGRT